MISHQKKCYKTSIGTTLFCTHLVALGSFCRYAMIKMPGSVTTKTRPCDAEVALGSRTNSEESLTPKGLHPREWGRVRKTWDTGLIIFLEFFT